MTRRPRTAIGTAAVCGALLLGGAACGSSSPSGPTAGQAGADLRTDFTAALKAFAHAGSEKPPYTVSSDASRDVPCGKGKARRVFTAEQQENGKGWTDPASMHTEIQTAAAYFGRKPGIYMPDLDAKNDEGPTKVSYAMLSTTHHARAVISATATADRLNLIFNGTSDCLPTS
ncbi:hypothetical protein AB0M29_44760 [Streptomyces sp. NPDC051976]|uniref:hypothetical protein n=1 Tax=Streptomyces sp. NPDC051976 TaxID=3154947 RepID=UPI0034446A57